MIETDQFTELTTALQYDSCEEKYLSAFDRMFIQKKRSALLNDTEYTLPESVNQKVQTKLSYIKKTGWISPY